MQGFLGGGGEFGWKEWFLRPFWVVGRVIGVKSGWWDHELFFGMQ